MAAGPGRDPDGDAVGCGRARAVGWADAGGHRQGRRRSRRSAAADIGAAAKGGGSRRGGLKERRMAKILIVEDNEMNRDMLSRRLVRRGYQIVLALDGAEGIAAARAETPDLILMDMSLPVVDGWEATRRLKADVGTRAIPVIGLTAHAMAG